MDLILNLMGEPTEASLTRALRKSVDDLLALGLTGAVTDDLGYYGDDESAPSIYKRHRSGEEIPCAFIAAVHRFCTIDGG